MTGCISPVASSELERMEKGFRILCLLETSFGHLMFAPSLPLQLQKRWNVSSGALCRGGGDTVFVTIRCLRHTPRRRGVQYAAALEIASTCQGLLDRPPSRTMTGEWDYWIVGNTRVGFMPM